jgi:chromate transporter
VWSSYVWEAFLVAAVAMVLAFRYRWSVLRVLGVCALLGLALTVLA